MQSIVDGKGIAEEILAGLEATRSAFPPILRMGIVMCKGDAATDSFVRIKERTAKRLGIELVRRELSQDATTEEACAAVVELSHITNGIVVQLPLPKRIDSEAVLSAVPADFDMDAINPTVSDSERPVVAPVAGAVREILLRARVEVAHATAVVVGAGRLVGLPVAWLLRELGAEVTVITKHDGSLESLLRADIVVLGAGVPGMVVPAMLKDGVVLIDAGTSESNGKVAGDASPVCVEKASVFTPVPGGVGPIAVAMLFQNFFTLVKKNIPA